MTLRAVLFDAGNTLVYMDQGRVRGVMEEVGVRVDKSDLARAELSARKALVSAVTLGHEGTEPELWQEYFMALFRDSGVPDVHIDNVSERVAEEHERAHLWTGTQGDTVEVLNTLASDGYLLGVISNADGRMETAIEGAGLRDHFEFVIDSDRVGMAKPDPEIFLSASHRLGLAPEQCLYVGDLYHVDVVGARGAGLDAVLLDPFAHIEFPTPVERVADLGGLPDYLASRGLRSDAPSDTLPGSPVTRTGAGEVD